MRRKNAIAVAVGLAVPAICSAAVPSVSFTAPTPGPRDIFQGQVTGTAGAASIDGYVGSGARKGQFFKTGASAGTLSSVAFYVVDRAFPANTLNIGIWSGGLIDEFGQLIPGVIRPALLYEAVALNSVSIQNSQWLTFTFDNPITLAPNTEYGLSMDGFGANPSFTGFGVANNDPYSYSGGFNGGVIYDDGFNYSNGFVPKDGGTDFAFYVGFAAGAGEATWTGGNSGNFFSGTN